jgi:hypothetical protein
MSHLLYAVTPPGTEVADLLAHRGEQVCVLHEQVDRTPERTVPQLLSFWRKLQQAARTSPVLPIRYATVLDDLDQLDSLVVEHQDAWARRLREIAGHSELIVHLSSPALHTPEDPAESRTSGAAFLQHRAARVRAREELRRGLLDHLDGAVADHRPLPAPDEERLALFVPDSGIATVRQRIDDWSGTRDDVTVNLSGPWPPFSFCEEVGP